MITQTYQIDLIPHGEPVVVHASQYDVQGRTLAFELFNAGVAWNIPAGSTAAIMGTKPDGTGFMYGMTVSGNTASIDIEQQMALLAGDVPAEIRVTSNGAVIGSANFIIRVEKAALDEETAISQTDIPVFEQLVERAETAATEAGNAADAAEDAQAATEALFPAGGTSGQFLQKTASGTAWADATGVPDGGTTGQVLTKQSSTDGDADWETPAYVPTTGTTGYVLTKTASGYEWASGGGADLIVTFTYNSGTYTADHTFAEIVECIENGGTPVGMFGASVGQLAQYVAGSYAAFNIWYKGGAYSTYRVFASGSVTYAYTNATTVKTVTLTAANWVGNVYTISGDSDIAALSNITVTLPDKTTEALKEAQIAEFAEYDLYAFNQVSQGISIYARGSVPTSDIQIVLIIEQR